LRTRTFLSLSLGPWSLSLVIHSLFFLGLVLSARNRFLILDPIDLDFAPLVTSAGAPQVVSSDEDWRKPQSVRRALPAVSPKPVPPSLPAVEPAPANPQGRPEAGAGKGEFRSLAQVAQVPQFINKVLPAYPDTARRAEIEGFVILQVDIDAAGAVKKVELIQGLGYGCDEAAIAAAEKSTFSPAMDQGGPVGVKMPLKYHFQLNDDSLNHF